MLPISRLGFRAGRRSCGALAAIALGLAAAGCQGGPTAAQTPSLPVQTTGTSTLPVANTQPPDEAAKQLMAMGTAVAPLLVAAIGQFAAPITAYYDARDRHAPGRYRVQELADWPNENGWYTWSGNGDERSLRLGLIDADNALLPWDPTQESLYDPSLHTAFPTSPVRFRFEIQQKLPAGGRFAVTLLAPIPPRRSDPLQAVGAGTAELGLPIGQVVFEALNGSFDAHGTVAGGDLNLRSVTAGETLQLGGRYDANGLVDNARVLVNAEPLGTLERAAGKWQLRNAGGTYPLP